MYPSLFNGDHTTFTTRKTGRQPKEYKRKLKKAVRKPEENCKETGKNWYKFFIRRA